MECVACLGRVHNKQVEHLTGYYEDEAEAEDVDEAEDKVQGKEAENETGSATWQTENEFPAKVQGKTLFLLGRVGAHVQLRTFSFMQRKSIISQASCPEET